VHQILIGLCLRQIIRSDNLNVFVASFSEAQYRPCKINADALRGAADWMEQYRAFWEESFDRLGDYLKTVTAKGGSTKADTASTDIVHDKPTQPKPTKTHK
jgi:hypothetical protein